MSQKTSLLLLAPLRIELVRIAESVREGHTPDVGGGDGMLAGEHVHLR